MSTVIHLGVWAKMQQGSVHFLCKSVTRGNVSNACSFSLLPQVLNRVESLAIAGSCSMVSDPHSPWKIAASLCSCDPGPSWITLTCFLVERAIEQKRRIVSRVEAPVEICRKPARKNSQ